MWFAGVIICSVLTHDCSVTTIKSPTAASYETQAQCAEVISNALPQIVKVKKLEELLLNDRTRMSAGCLERPDTWKPVASEFLEKFAPPAPEKPKKEQDA